MVVSRVSAAILLLSAALAFTGRAHAAQSVMWCGNGALQSAADRKPDLNAGPEVHVIYAHPSDTAGRIAIYGDAIASDAATTDAWWRAQDSARTVRYDTFAFPSCNGLGRLDISDVTLAHDSTYFQPLVAGSDRYDKITGDLPGFQSTWKKYVVYYDGPVASTNVCGQGGGVFNSGPNFAIVYLQACSLSNASIGYRAHVVTHELIHALGAVDSSAPHDCGGANTGHVCDSLFDVMYWQAQSTTTLDTDVLDVNHDDYYGNSAADDIRRSPWLSQLDAGQLAASVAITGPGTVTSDKPGIDCGSLCSNTWDKGAAFTLTANPAAGKRFAGWGGACSGTVSCNVTMDAAKSITATFVGRVQLTVSVDASKASGTIVSEPAGISCPGTCTVGPDGSRTVSATFGRATRTLAVSVGAHGTVTSAPAGIACPTRCTRDFAVDSVVTLTAKAAKGYAFSGWTGACHGKGACRVSLADDASVRATFKKQ